MSKKFTILDMSDVLRKSQSKATILLNKGVTGEGLRDALVFNTPEATLESLVEADSSISFLASPIDVAYVACLESDAEDMANTMFKLSDSGNVIGVIQADRWVEYLSKVTSILLQAHLQQQGYKAGSQIAELDWSKVTEEYGPSVTTVNSLTNVALGSDLSSQYNGLINSAYSYPYPSFLTSKQTSSRAQNQPYMAGMPMVNTEDIKRELHSLMRNPLHLNSSDNNKYRESESTVILVVNPKLILVKTDSLFSRMFIRDSVGCAMPADSLLTDLFSRCEEPAVLTSCYSCPKVLGNCYESLVEDSGLPEFLEYSEVFNSVSSSKISLRDILDISKGTTFPMTSGTSNTMPALWSPIGISRDYKSLTKEVVKELIESTAKLLQDSGYEYVSSYKAVDHANRQAFSKIDPREVDLSAESLEACRDYLGHIYDKASDTRKFKKEYCSVCIVAPHCKDIFEGAVNRNCKNSILDEDSLLNKTSGKKLSPSVLSDASNLIKLPSDAVKSAIANSVRELRKDSNKDSGILYKAMFYLPGTNIATTYRWGADRLVITDIVKEELLQVSGCLYTKLVRGSIDTVEVRLGSELKYTKSPSDSHTNTSRSLSSSFPSIKDYHLTSIVLDSAIGGNNCFLPRRKETAGWVARVCLVCRSTDAHSNDSAMKSVYVDLDVALSSVTCFAGSLGSGTSITSSGYETASSKTRTAVGIHPGASYNDCNYRAESYLNKTAGVSDSIKVKLWFLNEGVTTEDIHGASLLDCLPKFKKVFFDKKAVQKYLRVVSSGGLLGFYTIKGGFGTSSKSCISGATITNIYPGTGMISSVAWQNRSSRSSSNLDSLLCLSRLEFSWTEDTRVVLQKATSRASLNSQSLSWISSRSKSGWHYSLFHSSMGSKRGAVIPDTLSDAIADTNPHLALEYGHASTVFSNAISMMLSTSRKPGLKTNLPPFVRLYSSKTSGLFKYKRNSELLDNLESESSSLVIESYKSRGRRKENPRIKIMHADIVGSSIRFVNTKPSEVVGDYESRNISIESLDSSIQAMVDDIASGYEELISGVMAEVKVSKPDIFERYSDITASQIIKSMIVDTIPGEPKDTTSIYLRSNGKSALRDYIRAYWSGKVRSRICFYETPVCAVVYNSNTGEVLDKISTEVGSQSLAVYIPSVRGKRYTPILSLSEDRQGHYFGYRKFSDRVFMRTDNDVEINCSATNILRNNYLNIASGYKGNYRFSGYVSKFGTLNNIWECLTNKTMG